MKARITWILTAALVLTPAFASAQAIRGTVQGRVTDQSGQVVVGADVELVAERTGARRVTRTDARGWFLLTPVDPGAYDVRVTREGFRRHTQSVTMLVNQALRVDVVLQPGSISEVVTVTAPASQLDRSAGSLRFRIGADQVANLPLDGRNFLELALLGPGAAPAAQGSAGSVRGDFAFNVNGAREDANAFLLDGGYNFDPKLNSVGVRPPVDAIREFEVLTSAPDASFGRSAGAQVNVVTRSGSNRREGTAYEFLRTGAFNARNAFAPENEPAPDYKRHQYGGSFGAPIQRDRWFLFADYEGMRLSEGVTRVTNVPTLLERSGNFSEGRFTAPRNPFTGLPFDGNQVPGFFQHPVGRALALLYPEPNRAAPYANFVSSPVLDDSADQFDVRVDQVRARSTLTVRYSFSDRRLFEPFTGAGFAAVPGFGTDVPRRAQNLLGSYVSTFGRFVSEARVGWTRVATGVFQEGQGTSLNQTVGLPDLSANPRDWGLSFVSVAGFSPLGDEFNNPQQGTTNMFQIADTVSWVSGRHLFKTGGEMRFLAQEAFRDVQSRGYLTFTNQAFTGNALADLLLGLPTVTVGATVDNPQNLRASSYALFLQDTMQVSPTVTLSAGVRYELNTPPVDADDRVNLYDPATGTIVPVGEGGMPRAGYVADRNNLAPRLGVSWAARPSTIVRAGYGLSYDQAALAPNEFLYFNPPYFDLRTYFTIPGAYTLTLSDPFPAAFPFALPPSVTAVQRDLRTGFLHQWNVAVAQDLGAGRTLELAYVASRGRNLIAARDVNQPPASPSPLNLRPNPFFGDITMIESRARSTYDALEVRLHQRLERGLSFQASYTLGSSEDDASGFFSSAGDANFPQDSNAPGAEWARSNFDVRHRLALSGLWQLPFGPGRRWFNRGLGATCLGEWDVYFVLQAQSGRPFTVAIHPDIDRSNTGRASLGFGSNDRPNVSGDPSISNPTAARWFNTDAFVMQPFGSFGDAGRNSLEGPGAKALNLAFARRVPFSRGALQVRLEIFNAFNWTNLGLPDNFLGSPTFGQILSAGAPRRVQVGARYIF
jgi:hypothetical protein